MQFVYHPNSQRIIFGAGTLKQLPDEVAALGIKSPMVITTEFQKELGTSAIELLGDSFDCALYDKAVMHVPRDTINDIMAKIKAHGSDGCVCLGGGSTIGLGKAVALETGLPSIVIPTTYAGSEMTPIWGITEDGIKTTGRDMKVLAKTVIYDPELTFSLPDFISGPSGVNAIAHCVEALYAENKNPVTSLMAEEGIRALAESLPVVVKDPENITARSNALYGAWLAGTVLGTVGMAIHHKLCHTLGGSFNLPHAEVHSVIIPHATKYNQEDAPEAMQAIARALDSTPEDAPGALFDLLAKVGAPTTLEAIGMKEEDLDKAAEIALSKPYFNPREVTLEGVRELLQNAYSGNRP
ncbi:MAG: maleylacetate reductase [Gammaproteobacteria bacterium]|nr:maleylacetate reductase [Gammaproteobacteria bacterium]MAY02785.1 maleylacetate reductase [Gammaproteobacteria bacterium]|tara:strand:+ start:123637 stop:124698 length:1062 start_codon:yes stop_codon:yes gene_type:complete